MEKKDILELLDIIETCINNKGGEPLELSRFVSMPATIDNIFENAIHSLQHYISDEDIRAKDPEYGRLQADELMELVREIRTKYLSSSD